MTHQSRLQMHIGQISLAVLISLSAAAWVSEARVLQAHNANSWTSPRNINPGAEIISNNGVFTLIMQGDGNLVLYKAGGIALWASGLAVPGAKRPPYYLSMDADGNLRTFGNPKYLLNNGLLWTSNSGGRGTAPFQLTVLDNGNLVLNDANEVKVWETGTVQPKCDMCPANFTLHEMGHDNATYVYGKSCLSNCPTGWAVSIAGALSFADVYCVKPFPTKGRGVGVTAEGTCTSKAGMSGCEKCLGLWYSKCPVGYKAAGCNLCTQLCPVGTIDRGNNCERAIVVPTRGFC